MRDDKTFLLTIKTSDEDLAAAWEEFIENSKTDRFAFSVEFNELYGGISSKRSVIATSIDGKKAIVTAFSGSKDRMKAVLDQTKWALVGELWENLHPIVKDLAKKNKESMLRHIATAVRWKELK